MICAARRGAAVLATLLATAISSATAFAAATVPAAVSPGAPDEVATVATPCPTFTWTAAAGSAGSELSIWPVAETGELDSSGGPARRIAVPGDARSWTPSGDDCLEPDTVYAWRVRGEGGGWSEPLLLRVAGGPWLDEALEDVLFELLDERREADRARTAPAATARAEAPASGPAAALAPRGHTSGTASLHVDTTDGYGVWTGGESQGLFASASKLEGRAVYALVTGSGAGPAIHGTSTLGKGVHGTGGTHGVQGISGEPTGIGVQGLQSGIYLSGGSGCGVGAVSFSDGGRGLTGRALANAGTSYGVYGATDDPSGFDFFAAGTGSYMPFTGAHEVRLAGDPDAIRPGMVVSVTGRAEVRRGPDGTIGLSSTLPTVELARHPHDPAVLGVFVGEMKLPADHWAADRSGRFGIVNALGEGRVWVTDANGPVAAGDYLTTSAIPGYAQRQGDDVLRSSTLGKATEAVDWSAAEGVTGTVEHDGRTYRARLIAVVYTSG